MSTRVAKSATVACLIVCGGCGASAVHNVPAPAAPQSWTIGVAPGVALYVESLGRGRDTLVLLHGGPGLTAANVLPDFAALGDQFTVLSYDQRGAGRSTQIEDSTRVTIGAHVADLEALRSQLHLDRMTLVGHSWGGGLAVRYALAYPSRVKRLILIDPVPPRRGTFITEFSRNVSAWMDSTTRAKVAAANQLWTSGPDAMAGCREYWSIFQNGYFANPRQHKPMKGEWCVGPPAGVRAFTRVNRWTFASIGRWDWSAEAKALLTPTLIIHGAQDPLPLAGSREWLAALPQSRLLIVKDAGHYPFVEQSELVMSAIGAFARGVWPPGAVAAP
ncbi:MAG TPA: alpha/beta hydrolase [Gemmatimonadaceae bacterium]|nr:alpha/beta hydrolase [Gemmatimonadaceae bacterium]